MDGLLRGIDEGQMRQLEEEEFGWVFRGMFFPSPFPFLVTKVGRKIEGRNNKNHFWGLHIGGSQWRRRRKRRSRKEGLFCFWFWFILEFASQSADERGQD
jgi:hypothetical protein